MLCGGHAVRSLWLPLPFSSKSRGEGQGPDHTDLVLCVLPPRCQGARKPIHAAPFKQTQQVN